jgi:hypothetical protein
MLSKFENSFTNYYKKGAKNALKPLIALAFAITGFLTFCNLSISLSLPPTPGDESSTKSNSNNEYSLQ